LNNNNIELFPPFEIISIVYEEFPTAYASSSNIGYSGNLDQFPSNPGISDSSTGSEQPGNSGSNNNNNNSNNNNNNNNNNNGD
jgi:hypothetical protein